MKVFDTPHKKKSAGLTLITAFLLIFLFFFLGLSYYDPPVSYGMEVNFGNSINFKPFKVLKNFIFLESSEFALR